MEHEERMDEAKRVLGNDSRVIKGHKPGGKKKTKPLSSFIPRKTKGRRDMSRSEYQQCGRKLRYNSEADARKYAARLSAERGYPIRVYQCRFCLGYHLTHKKIKSAV